MSIFDVDSGIRLGAPISIPDGDAEVIGLSLDGTTLVLGGGATNGVQVWDLRPQAWIDGAVPRGEPYAIVAESFSGPVAIAHAAARPDNLVAVVLAASFVANPLPRGLRWLGVFAGVVRAPLPRFAARLLLVGRSAPGALVCRG